MRLILSHPHHDYYTDASDAQELVREAVQKSDDTIDFSKYDNNNDGIVDQVAVIHQGAGEETSGNSKDIWSHHWQIDYTTSDGVDVEGYTIQPELQYDQMSTVGVFAHEFGHAFGLPDLYDTDFSSLGIGRWGLMAYGTWNDVNRSGDSPAHPCPWSRKFMGWSSPTMLSGTEIHPSTTLRNSVEHNEFYQVLDPDSNSDGEYFLVEKAARKGFNQGLPGSGVLIYHVIRSLRTDDNCILNNDCNDNEDRKMVDLEAADGTADLDSGDNYGDPGDPWQSGSFYPSSTPDSDYNDGTNSGVTISSVNIIDGIAHLTISTTPRSVLEAVWSTDLVESPQFSSPSFGPDHLFIGGLGNRFYAIDRVSGNIVWNFSRDGNLADSSPAVANGTVYVGSGGGILYALNTSDGSVKWQFSTDSAIVSSPRTAIGIVYFGTNDGVVFALNTSDGTEAWRYDVGSPVYSTPHIADSSVYVSTADGRLVSLSTDSSLEWSVSTNVDTGHSSPAVSESTVYFASEQLNALDPTDGSVQWSTSLGHPGGTPVIDSGTVYIGDQGGTVTAVASADGTSEWTFSTNSGIISGPTLYSGRLLVGTDTGNLYLINAADGTEITQKSFPEAVRSTPGVIADVAFVSEDSGGMHALVNVDGT